MAADAESSLNIDELFVGPVDGLSFALCQFLQVFTEMGDLVGMIARHLSIVRRADLLLAGAPSDPEYDIGIKSIFRHALDRRNVLSRFFA